MIRCNHDSIFAQENSVKMTQFETERENIRALAQEEEARKELLLFSRFEEEKAAILTQVSGQKDEMCREMEERFGRERSLLLDNLNNDRWWGWV